MYNPDVAAVILGGLGVALFVLGVIAKWAWDSREGGKRAQLAADAWSKGRAAGRRDKFPALLFHGDDCPGHSIGSPGRSCREAWHLPPEPQEAPDGDWEATLAEMPRVPAHEPEAAPARVMLPRTGASIREQGFVYRRDPEAAAAGLGVRAWEVTGEGLEGLPALLVGPGKPRDHDLEAILAAKRPEVYGALGLEALAAPCPRCRGSRWQTISKGAGWRCRRCGYERWDDGAGPEHRGGEAGGNPDPGRIGGAEPDHAPVLADGSRPVSWVLADWDASGSERRATVAERAAAAEFAVWETELGGLIASAYDALDLDRPAPRQLEVHHDGR